VLGAASEHIGEPGLRVDVVEFRRHDQRGHDGGAVGAAFGAGKEPRLASQGKSAQCTFGRIVSEADAAVVDEAREPNLSGGM
jgi:hypothetical protein